MYRPRFQRMTRSRFSMRLKTLLFTQSTNPDSRSITKRRLDLGVDRRGKSSGQRQHDCAAESVLRDSTVNKARIPRPHAGFHVAERIIGGAFGRLVSLVVIINFYEVGRQR